MDGIVDFKVVDNRQRYQFSGVELLDFYTKFPVMCIPGKIVSVRELIFHGMV